MPLMRCPATGRGTIRTSRSFHTRVLRSAIDRTASASSLAEATGPTPLCTASPTRRRAITAFWLLTYQRQTAATRSDIIRDAKPPCSAL
jgi:hypothetical protein